ncbi:MAG: hypothetical protein GTO18_01855 [Anaerolineales bacterium]|nr:hypothetical protein [Anaerolineales bacterium]
MKPSRRTFFLIAIVLVLVFAFAATVAEAHSASASETATLSPIDRWLPILKSSQSSEPPPVPERDTCLHCHLSGTIESLWVPLTRWSIFGIAGLIFVFGVYRTGSVVITREKWKPLWQRAVDWLDVRYQLVEPIQKILKKPVPLFSTKWWYCLGGIAFTLLLIQGVTGILLAFYYKPTPAEAHASIQFIENEVRFGSAIRSIHHWTANATIIVVVAHLIRVFITGAFKPPRELNWVSGVLLLILTLGFGFTGYLLPWDQRAFWATTVGSEIAGGIPWIGDLSLVFLRGGWTVTAVTLSRFYAVHVLVLPAVIILLLGMHFLMVRRQGIARPL